MNCLVVEIDANLTNRLRNQKLQLRFLTAKDLPRASFLASHAFRRGAETNIPMERWMSPDRTRFGIEEGGELLACFSIQDFKLMFGEELHPCGGICGVMVDPAARGRGYARDLIHRGLEIMRDKGQYLSNLWPFNHQFYQGYGWDWTGWYQNVTIPVHHFKSDPEAKNVRLAREDSWPLLATIYEARASQSNGAILRNETQWREKFGRFDGRERLIFVHESDGVPDGYAFLRYDSEPRKATINEFVALNGQAWRGLLGALHNMAMTVDTITLQLGMRDEIWSHLVHWSVESKRLPNGMGRIVDLPKALEACSSENSVSGSCVISVEDKHAPWNTGNWQINIENGHAEVTETQVETGVTLDICALSQAYWGSPNLDDLRLAGRLEVHREEDFAILKNLLPANDVWLQDDF